MRLKYSLKMHSQKVFDVDEVFFHLSPVNYWTFQELRKLCFYLLCKLNTEHCGQLARVAVTAQTDDFFKSRCLFSCFLFFSVLSIRPCLNDLKMDRFVSIEYRNRKTQKKSSLQAWWLQVCGGGIAKNKDGSPILVSQWMTFSESYSHHKMLSERESETAERGKKKQKSPDTVWNRKQEHENI